jgi:hypothetical protein
MISIFLHGRGRNVVEAGLVAEAGEGRLLAVDEHRHAGTAPELQLSFLGDGDARQVLHRLEQRAARLAEVVGNAEGFLVEGPRHGVGAAGDGYFLQVLHVLVEVNGAEVEVGAQVAHPHGCDRGA